MYLRSDKQVALMLLVVVDLCQGWGNSAGKKVLLKNVEVITLHENEMTAGRRSSPVPQLQCVDQGSASCSDHKPKMVQCFNKGSDGMDVQWECKGTMDKSIQFGRIEVSCEGYDYPDDPYVLAGSCGLRYSLDYLSASRHRDKSGGFSGSSKSTSWSSFIADMIVWCAVGLMAYAMYRSCVSRGREAGEHAYSGTSDDYPSGGQGGGGGGGYGWFGGQRPGYDEYDTNGAGSCRNRGTQRGNGGAGFWTGAATGGLLGYMFGQGGRRQQYGTPSYGGFGSGGSSSSSGSYTSTGFGGTSRR